MSSRCAATIHIYENISINCLNVFRLLRNSSPQAKISLTSMIFEFLKHPVLNIRKFLIICFEDL